MSMLVSNKLSERVEVTLHLHVDGALLLQMDQGQLFGTFGRVDQDSSGALGHWVVSGCWH